MMNRTVPRELESVTHGRSRATSSLRERAFLATEILLYIQIVLSLTLGGGSIAANWRILAICLISSLLFATATAAGAWAGFAKLPRLARIAIPLVLLLPLAQLIPLPPSIWSALPGRQLPADIFALLGASDQWHPLTLTPRETWFSLLLLLPPFAAFLGVLTFDDKAKERCVAVFLAVVGISVLVGLAQLASRGGIFNFYNSAHKANLVGFFANRNHQSLMLAIAATFSIAMVQRKIRTWQGAVAWSAILSVTFLVAAVGTISRAGLGLTFLSVFASAYAFFFKGINRRGKIVAIAAFAILIVFVYFLSFSVVVEKALTRFNAVGDDDRWTLWQLSWPLVGQYMPWGSGLGSFVPAYAAIENLNTVTPSYVNHAHNDYLELLIEAGVPGMAVLACLVVAIFVRAVGALRGTQKFAAFGLSAMIGILLTGIHSVVDYPLRTQSHLALFGVMLALFFAIPVERMKRVRTRLATANAD